MLARHGIAFLFRDRICLISRCLEQTMVGYYFCFILLVSFPGVFLLEREKQLIFHREIHAFAHSRPMQHPKLLSEFHCLKPNLEKSWAPPFSQEVRESSRLPVRSDYFIWCCLEQVQLTAVELSFLTSSVK